MCVISGSSVPLVQPLTPHGVLSVSGGLNCVQQAFQRFHFLLKAGVFPGRAVGRLSGGCWFEEVALNPSVFLNYVMLTPAQEGVAKGQPGLAMTFE